MEDKIVHGKLVYDGDDKAVGACAMEAVITVSAADAEGDRRVSASVCSESAWLPTASGPVTVNRRRLAILDTAERKEKK